MVAVAVREEEALVGALAAPLFLLAPAEDLSFGGHPLNQREAKKLTLKEQQEP